MITLGYAGTKCVTVLQDKYKRFTESWSWGWKRDSAGVPFRTGEKNAKSNGSFENLEGKRSHEFEGQLKRTDGKNKVSAAVDILFLNNLKL